MPDQISADLISSHSSEKGPEFPHDEAHMLGRFPHCRDRGLKVMMMMIIIIVVVVVIVL